MREVLNKSCLLHGESLEELSHFLAHLGGVTDNVDACSFESGDLVGGSTLTSGNDSASVTHATAWRGSLSSDEADNGEVAVVVLADPFGSLFLGLTTDLSDHDDTLGLGVDNELTENIDEVSSVEGITANTDDSGLSESLEGGLVNSLVGEGAGAGNDTDLTLGVDVARHDADLALTRLDDSWAVRSDETGLGLRLHDGLDLDHVEGGDALSDADNEVHLGFDGLEDGVSSEGRGDVDDGSLSVGGGLGLSD